MNHGIEFEKKAIRLAHAEKSADISVDYLTKKGIRTECKFFRIAKTDNYKKAHAVYNSAHAHEWVRNEKGEIDYLLTCEKFADECDVLKVGFGASWDNCETFFYRSKKQIYAFYFCRLQYQSDKNGRLCANPKANKNHGREKQLQTLRDKGIVNVPTFDEVCEMYDKYFG